jgi:two-component sensor histidine kinase
MIAEGSFPVVTERGDHADTPRVGDGFLRLEADGRVGYASPNALSLYRRLGHHGDLDGVLLADVTRALVPADRREDEETLSAILGGHVNRDTEVANGHVSLIVRSIALRREGRPTGALVLVRDVTDLRRRDRELVTKDATIREIHHRVKNNLQTVAALLRLQARRIDEPAAREALQEAVRRVGSIAIVHETLSQSLEGAVGFDEVADRLGAMVTDVSATGERVRVRRRGSFGSLPSEVATALAMVLTEALQNAVEHGYPDGADGQIVVSARRGRDRLHVEVLDDGVGLPAEFDQAGAGSLGLSIVRTLVETELGGTLQLGPAPGAGRRGVRLAFDLRTAG